MKSLGSVVGKKTRKKLESQQGFLPASLSHSIHRCPTWAGKEASEETKKGPQQQAPEEKGPLPTSRPNPKSLLTQISRPQYGEIYNLEICRSLKNKDIYFTPDLTYLLRTLNMLSAYLPGICSESLHKILI